MASNQLLQQNPIGSALSEPPVDGPRPTAVNTSKDDALVVEKPPKSASLDDDLRDIVLPSNMSTVATRLNCTIIATSVLWGSFYNMLSLPVIAESTVLKSLGSAACISDASALLCALTLRLRMLYLQRQGRAEPFAEDYVHRVKTRRWDALCLASPETMLSGSLILLLCELTGLIWKLDGNSRSDGAPPFTTRERAFVCALTGLFVAYYAAVVNRTLKLGERRPGAITLAETAGPDALDQASNTEKQ